MPMFEKSQWIWENANPSPDEYADFSAHVDADKATIFIAAETDYAVYVNGNLAAFGAYKGYRTVKYYDEVSLDAFLRTGGNEVEIVVHYHGVNCSSSIDDGAGVIFEIVSGGEVVAASGKDTPSRIDTRYKNGYKKRLTPQLGYSFLYDATKTPSDFGKSVVLSRKAELLPRPVGKLVVSEPAAATLVKSEGSVYTFDLQRELAGQLYLDFCSDREQKLTISYGEHMKFGKVERIIGNRDFSVEYIAKKGRNRYVNPFLRLGLRFLEVAAEYPADINAATVLPVCYPLVRRKFVADTPLRARITEVATDTLALCMHEHYEDCVWREQALYTFDSRNEMLCDYFAFENSGFARANLLLIAKGVRDDGFLELTYPAVDTPAIPLYSLCYVVQVYEYVKFTGDKSILPEVGKTLDGIMNNFRKLADNRLIADFQYPFWNFYEWGNDSDNCGDLSRQKDALSPTRYSLIFNAYYVYAEERFAALFPDKATDVGGIKDLISAEFYNPDKKMFRAYKGEENYTEFANAMAILIGVGDKTVAREIAEGKAKKATLAAAAYVYDALLSYGDEFKERVLSEIDDNYKKMLDAGATSFWETLEGVTENDRSCSLCHGWSALPIYYYAVTGKIKYEKED